MTVKAILAKLESLGNESVRKHNVKWGAGDKQFGVKMGDVRKIAKGLKADRKLAFELWETGILEARLVAILILKPKELTADDLDRMAKSGNCAQVADWFNSYIARSHPEKEALRVKWMAAKDPWAARAGWSLTSERIGKTPEGLDLPGLLDRIEKDAPKADSATQWTMNFCLAGIGIHVPKLRKRAIEIGEKLGMYRDYPVSKGCTSPFAPIWIAEMVKRQG